MLHISQINVNVNPGTPVSSKSRITAIVLCFFLAALGIHRFYVGKIGTGLIWMFTAGCFGIGWLVDFISLLLGSFSDCHGFVLK